MQSDNPSRPAPDPAGRGESRAEKPPKPDLQPEDAGTPESGQDPAGAGRGTAAEPALKQTGKTNAETGSR